MVYLCSVDPQAWGWVALGYQDDPLWLPAEASQRSPVSRRRRQRYAVGGEEAHRGAWEFRASLSAAADNEGNAAPPSASLIGGAVSRPDQAWRREQELQQLPTPGRKAGNLPNYNLLGFRGKPPKFPSPTCAAWQRKCMTCPARASGRPAIE